MQYIALEASHSNITSIPLSFYIPVRATSDMVQIRLERRRRTFPPRKPRLPPNLRVAGSPRAPRYQNGRFLGYVTIGYIQLRTHYLGNWEP